MANSKRKKSEVEEIKQDKELRYRKEIEGEYSSVDVVLDKTRSKEYKSKVWEKRVKKKKKKQKGDNKNKGEVVEGVWHLIFRRKYKANTESSRGKKK